MTLYLYKTVHYEIHMIYMIKNVSLVKWRNRQINFQVVGRR